jgi:hypothetical protein
MSTRHARRIARISVILLVAVTARARAQDSNYWSTAYGTRSQLLGGVVIGSPGDISSVYYNPGALALTKSTELLLAGNAYQYQHVSVDNGSGPGKTLVASSLAAVPSLFAGEVPVLKHDRLAYAFLTRRSMDMEIDSRSTTGVGALAPITNPVFAAGEIQLHQTFSEGWYGLTWAHSLTPTLGFGVSPFVVVRSQHTRAALLTEGQDAGGQAAILTSTREFDYLHWGALARIGLAGARDSLTYGLTLTTPSLGITGSGNTQYNTTLVDQTGAIGTVVGADYQNGVKADFRSPLGAGAGASYGWGQSRIHAAVDWNAAVGQYTVIESPDFVIHTPSGDSTARLVITDHLNAVVNWGIGIEHRFSRTLSGFASYHTDRSGRIEGEPPGAALTRWNLNDVAAGAIWHVWRSDLALGIAGAFANQPTPAPPSLPDGKPVNADLRSNVMLVTVTLGWKITF